MDKHILKHREEQAEEGVEKTPEEVGEWFLDVKAFCKSLQIEVSPETVVETVDELRDILPPRGKLE